MTIDTNTNSNRYTATSGQTVFAYGFRILEEGDIDVYQNGTLLTLTTHYTLSGVDSASGGNVTLVTGATALDKITLLRSKNLTQEDDYTENDDFPAESHEKALDKVTTNVQRQDEVLDRTPRLTVDSTYTALTMEDPEAGKFLKWNAGLTGLENGDGGAGSGDVTGPGSSVDNTLPRFAGTTGEVIQSSGIVVDDSDNVTGMGTLNGRTLATDAAKLDAIEASADVTDTANVNAALAAPGGALVWNESAGDHDVRYESTTQDNKFSIDAGENLLQTRPGTATSGQGQIMSATISDSTDNATGAGTSEQDLTTYSLPANALSKTGDAVRVTVWGVTAANTNGKQLKFYFGTDVILDTGSVVMNNEDWFQEFIVIRTGASTQDYLRKFGFIDSTATTPAFGTATQALGSAVTIKVTGTDAVDAAGDITQKGMIVEVIPSA